MLCPTSRATHVSCCFNQIPLLSPASSLGTHLHNGQGDQRSICGPYTKTSVRHMSEYPVIGSARRYSMLLYYDRSAEPRRLHERWVPGGAFRLSIMPVKGRRTEIPKRTTDLSNFIHRLSFVHLRDYTNLRVAGPWGERSVLEG
ncbi:hypothetical protein SCLCIDRAFT_836330 [Scleroderma citrinum Foug A]|uniref:Uncharacterized protein n=1 Tax=Scleroderma citrinum Foug A TaxID=1036808 RepID=A0A0C3E1E4_9AGAM|nr:hypothetical protein SCLCIDRAFT_836330 [Scleroderma citrinum Foug A]